MSVFQKLGLWKPTGDAPRKENEIKVEEIDDEQPHNPFTEILILQHHSDIVRQLVVVDERRCVSVAEDNLAIVWDINMCMKQYILSGHTRPITPLLLLRSKVDFTDLLLSGSSDKTIRVWDLDQGKCLQIITDHAASVKCLLCIHGDVFLSGGRALHLWSGEGRLLSAFTRKDEEEDISLMIQVRGQPHDRVVTAAGKQLSVYQIETSEMDDGELFGEINFVKKLPAHVEAIRCLVYISDSCLASGSLDGTIMIWSTQTFLPTFKFNTVDGYKGEQNLYPYSIQHVVCIDERFLMAAIGSGFGLFDIATRKLICKKVKAHYSKVLHLAFVCDGEMLATCSEDGSIRLWGQTPHSGSTDDKGEMNLKPMERFLDMSYEQLRQYQSDVPEPALLGECLAHSGAVQMIVDCGLEGMLSCGVDGLVIAWKNVELQNMKRNQLIQEQFSDPSKIVLYRDSNLRKDEMKDEDP